MQKQEQGARECDLNRRRSVDAYSLGNGWGREGSADGPGSRGHPSRYDRGPVPLPRIAILGQSDGWVRYAGGGVGQN